MEDERPLTPMTTIKATLDLLKERIENSNSNYPALCELCNGTGIEIVRAERGTASRTCPNNCWRNK